MKNSVMCRLVKDALDEGQLLPNEQLRHLDECRDCFRYREAGTALKSFPETVPELHADFEWMRSHHVLVKAAHRWTFAILPIAAAFALFFGALAVNRLAPRQGISRGVGVATTSASQERYNPEETDLRYIYEMSYR